MSVWSIVSNHDRQSLALYQEYIELDLFHNGLAKFSDEDFENAGLNAEDRYLIQFMADQEVGHANMITNILGRESSFLKLDEWYRSVSSCSHSHLPADSAPKQCNYTYPYESVRDFVDFCQTVRTYLPSSPTAILISISAHSVRRVRGVWLSRAPGLSSRSEPAS